LLRVDDFHKSLLVLEGWRDGLEYGGHLASISIMGCLANRAKAGVSWIDVISNVENYAAEPLPNRDKFPSIWDASFMRLLTEVEGIYEGSAKDLSCGALYWCDSRRIEKEWFLREIIRSGNYKAVSNMNSLTFYK
jgi:hypothetical protein